MADDVRSDEILKMAGLVGENLGLHFPEDRLQDLFHRLGPAAPEMGFTGAAPLVRALISRPWSRGEMEALAGHLTVGETYFFRDDALFQALREEILPSLVRARAAEGRPPRIWCAGCASGEEPYSLAILLHTFLPPELRRGPSILATDINPAALRKAEVAVYGEWSLRGTPEDVRRTFFRQVAKGRYELLRTIRERVTFQPLNLARDAYPSLANGTNAMDLILCRNVLMYFGPALAGEVVGGLSRALVEGGWLAVSPCEVSQVDHQDLARAHAGEAILHQKRTGAARQGAPSARPPAWEPLAAVAPSLPPLNHEPPEKPPVPRPAPAPPPSLEAIESLYRDGQYREAAHALSLGARGAGLLARELLLGARCYANLGELGEARSWCERAIRADKLAPGAHYLLATILMEQGREHEAADALRRAMYIEPGFVLAHWTMGYLAHRRGEASEALRHRRNARALLTGLRTSEMLPESDGLTAGRLLELMDLADPVVAGSRAVSAAPGGGG